MPHVTAYRRLLAAALALSAASWMVARAQAGPGITDSTILIGVEGSTQAFASDEENLGMHLVAREVNSRGGVHGRLLDIRSYPRPASATPDDVLANVKKLVEEDGVFLIFNHGGPSAMSIAPYAMRLKVPYMFPHTALVTADADRYVFTSYPRYLGESQVMLRYLSETRGFKRIGIVHDANVYGRYFLDRLLEYAPRFGYAVAGTLALTERKPGDLREALSTVRQTLPEAVVLALYPEQAKAVMDATSRLEWSGVRMVSSGPLTDEQYLNVPGGFAEGTLGFCYYPDPNVAREPGIEQYPGTDGQALPGTCVEWVLPVRVCVWSSRRRGPRTRRTPVDQRTLHRRDGVSSRLGERRDHAAGQLLADQSSRAARGFHLRAAEWSIRASGRLD